jgi:DedD protein
MAMAEPADINVDELRRRARRRLVGAVVLALGVAVVVPMLLETEQKPLGEDISVRIPPIDDSKFVNRISEGRAKSGASAPAEPGVSAAAPAPRYDTRLPEAATPAAAASAGAAGSAAAATPKAADANSPAAAKGSGAARAAKPAGAAAESSKPPVAVAPEPSKSSSVTAPEPSKPSAAAPAAASKSAGTPAPPRADAKPPIAVVAAPEPAAATAKAPPPHEGFAVQLAAFADDKGANALAGRLKKGGYAAYTEPLKTSKGTLWRVRVGPYPSREAAVAARDKLKTEGQSGIVAAVK